MAEQIKITVIGAAGRMGRELVRQITVSEKFKLVGAIENKNSEFIGKDAYEVAKVESKGLIISNELLDAVVKSDALIDFSSIDSTLSAIEFSAQSRIVHVIGTTGFDDNQEDLIRAAARHATIIKSGNMSLGVNILLGIAKKTSELVDDTWDIEINEVHHKEKKDHPSGTALDIGSFIAEVRNVELKKVKEISDPIDITENIDLTSKSKNVSRKKGLIGFTSYRQEGVVGDHSVVFSGNNERIALSHIAENRNIFSKGALRAAEWGVEQEPGLFSMIDVLGF
ncbi:MAG: 4-hydroxy-tetrahydrodipicolinate reductase [Pseudomonadota bacterium]|nr:4-hydroxy-tetrahydrodipicolinate reductase [Pseudomonadota bacterium]MEC9382269.1 4-hydroxy-tetrahydrodipicolinate reductase [Pseudomonadota bacterium]MEC9459304.1 4-hydroxy-tetrahydrodipicolinate reductase [Pseudomonadota bacterium]